MGEVHPLPTGKLVLGAVAAVLLPFSSADAGEKVERLEIVDRAIEHHGGEAYDRSHRRLRLCSKSGCFRIDSKVDSGLYDHDIVRESDGRRVHATNDSIRRWEGGHSVLIPKDEEQRWRDWVNQRIYFTFLPYALNDPSVYKEDHGLVDWQGRKLHRVKVSFQPGTSSGADSEYLYWFDPETGRLEQFAYSYENGLRFRTGFNYRRVGGILLADNENYGIDEKGLSVDLVADPAWVEAEMKHLSTVTLEDVEITSLD